MAKIPLTTELDQISDILASSQYIKYDTRAGTGSTNTQIPYFTNLTEQLQTGLQLFIPDNSTVLGNSFTVIRKCELTMTFNCSHSNTGEVFGISKNATNVSMTTIGGLAAAAASIRLTQAHTLNDAAQSTSVTLICQPGDIIRAHPNNANSNVGTAVRWYVTVSAKGVV